MERGPEDGEDQRMERTPEDGGEEDLRMERTRERERERGGGRQKKRRRRRVFKEIIKFTEQKRVIIDREIER
jgi:hypothetical protein